MAAETANMNLARAPIRPWLLFRVPVAAMLALILVGSVFGTDTAYALDPTKRLTQYLHTSWRTQDGSAPAADMLSITQTSDGFLWLVAPVGLYRFDGVKFISWTLPKAVLLHSIANVHGDRAGGLWVLSDNGVAHLKEGVAISHFELRGFQGQSTQNVSEDSDGSLWVVRGTADSLDRPLCHVTDRSVKCFGKTDGIPIAPINSLMADGSGGFWLGGLNELVHWHGAVSERYATGGQIVSLAPRSSDSLWLGMLGEGGIGRGLAQWNNGTVKSFAASILDGRKVDVTRIVSDGEGNLWVGTLTKGLFRINGNSVEHYDHTEGLSSDTVWSLFVDREGVLWVATSEGLDSFRDAAITSFTVSEGMPANAAVGVMASTDGRVFVANYGSLDIIANGKISSIRMGAGLPGTQVTSLLQDRAGNIWIGVDDHLYLFKGGRFRRLPEPNEQPLGMVVALTEDINGDIWAECAGDRPKLVRIRDFQVREVFPASQVPSGHSLAPDPQGGIWIGTGTGDIALFRNGVAQQRFAVNLSGHSMKDMILAQADRTLLAGSTDGLFGLRDGKTQRMTKKNGLPCNWVYSFVEDKAKDWWLSTECGIVKLPDTELQRWWGHPDRIVQTRLYGVLDGARPAPPSFTSAAYSSDGRIWFVTGAVVQMLDPSKLPPTAPPAQTFIETVTVDRNSFRATDTLQLPPHPRDVEIFYTSPTLTIPQLVRFRYRLEPYDRDWHDVGTRRQAFYTDLPPGKYTFRVIAGNSDDVWNDSAKLNFSVTPAYYQTAWFRGLSGVLLLALLCLAYQLRVRRLQQQFAMTLEARVDERTRIARELHDTLLQSFSGVLLRFRTAHTLLSKRPDEAQQILASAIDDAREALTEGRQAVQGLRPSALERHELVEAIQTLTEQLASDPTHGSGAEIRLNVEGTPRRKRPLIRDEIYRIASEALRNAFRHAEASRIEVQLSYNEKSFELRVRDDGKGIDPELLSDECLPGHFGLRGMRERAQRIGGKFTVWSAPASGTELVLSVPGAIAYDQVSARRAWFARGISATRKKSNS